MDDTRRFLSGWFGGSDGNNPIEVVSLTNERDAGRPQRVFTRSLEVVEAFIARHDTPADGEPGRGVYFSACPLAAGATRRCKETVAEIVGLWADVDFRDHDTDPLRVYGVLSSQLKLLPTFIVHSGGGLHAYFKLAQPLAATQETVERVEQVLRLLADHVGGDPSVCEVARLMRLPGSHNSRHGRRDRVQVPFSRPVDNLYDLDALEHWLTWAKPVLVRKPRAEAATGNGASDDPGSWSGAGCDPYARIAREQGWAPAIDVDEALGAMRYPANVHETQLKVTAALLGRGQPVEDIVGRVLEATRQAAGVPSGWNWKREERGLRAMCETWRAKHPELAGEPAMVTAPVTSPECPPRVDDPPPIVPEPEAVPEVEAEPEGRPEAAPEGATAGDGGEAQAGEVEAKSRSAPVVQLAAAREKRDRKAGGKNVIAALADGALAVTEHRGGRLLAADGELFLYRDGLWRVMSPADEQAMKAELQRGCDSLKQEARTSLVNAAWNRLRHHPRLFRAEVTWAQGTVTADGRGLAVANGVLDLETKLLEPCRPDHWLRHRLEVPYVPGAKCPRFLALLDEAFADRPDEREATITVLQEYFGAAIAPHLLNREQRRAMVLVGPSRTGKTGLATSLRYVLGGTVAAPSVVQVGERFGRECFVGASAWIADDAVADGDRVDPAIFKTIVTGEPINISRKGRVDLPGVRLALPVLFTLNVLPKARDVTDAVINRCIVIRMRHVVNEEQAAKKRQEAGVPRGGTSLEAHIAACEGPGILNWALAGLDELVKRGRYDLPKFLQDELEDFKDKDNLVAAWARTALAPAPDKKVSRRDMLEAHHGWQQEQDGDNAKLRSARGFPQQVLDACPYITEIRTDTARFYGGVALTEEGLLQWSDRVASLASAGKLPAGLATAAAFVNQPWDPQAALTV